MCIAERWIDSVVDVVRVNERIMYVKLVIGKQIVNIVSAYAPHMGLSVEEKDTAPNNTAYTRWSCHSGLANPVQIVSTPPAPSNGGQITIFGKTSHADPLNGWYCF